MENTIKSGKDVICDFLAGIYNIPDADPEVIGLFLRLYERKMLTEKSVQVGIERLIEQKINRKDE